MKNMIRTHLTAAEQTTIDNLITQLETALEGKLAALGEDERRQYGSINEQNKLLVNKVRDYSKNSPAMSAPEVDWTEFEADYQSRQFLESRADKLRSLAYQMQSTKILHDYDNYQDALTDYGYAQYKKGANENGYAEKVADLNQFFPKSGKTSASGDGNNNG